MKLKEEVPYSCIRCSYTTYKKSSMINHFNRAFSCPSKSLEHDIELTDEIKEKILENRRYFIPKVKKETKKKKPKEEVTNQGSIYLFYPRACKNCDESVYKIGKSEDYTRRKKDYMKGGDMLFVVNVSDRHVCENIVKENFRNEFILRRDYGLEYFEGDVFEMVAIIKDVLENYIESTEIEFDYLPQKTSKGLIET